jgi:hypothetical protein
MNVPPNRAAKRHLRTRVGGLRQVHVACGLVNPPFTTRDPGAVTCGACKRTQAMADAEILARRSQRKGQGY